MPSSRDVRLPHFTRLVAFLFGTAVALLGALLASTYISRLSQHRGYLLVAVEDVVRAKIAARPRRTVVIVVDGLRADRAEEMRVTSLLRAEGQCLRMDVGLPTVSRPVYAVLSTGLEQDRTGARNNDETSPLAAESIWDVARRSGLTLEVRSELSWWTQLFPSAFERDVRLARADDGFQEPLARDVTLIHPVYVDENGHDFGAASPEYTAAVTRADEEIARLLRALDLSRDLVVLTADHGHRARGGHGGDGAEIREVLTCFAGSGVLRQRETGRLDARTFAPALSMLLGVAFPKHMRAGEDDLDALGRLVDPARLGRPFVDDRLAAIAHFREENAIAVERFSGGSTRSWGELMTMLRVRQLLRALAVSAVGLLALVLWVRRSGVRARSVIVHVVIVTTVILVAYALLAGGLDSNSINKRAFFIRNASIAGGLGVVLGRLVGFVERRLARDRSPIAQLDLATFSAIALVTFELAHLAAYGWPLGCPIPSPYLFFAPFLASMATLFAGLDVVLGAVLGGASTFRARDAP